MAGRDGGEVDGCGGNPQHAVAEWYPQTVYAGFTFCTQNEWQYVQRVVTDTAPFFSPLEEVIYACTSSLPSLVSPRLNSMGSTASSSHTASSWGLAICNPVDTAPSVHTVSLAVATCHLTVSHVDPATRFDPGAHHMCTTEAMSRSFSTATAGTNPP